MTKNTANTRRNDEETCRKHMGIRADPWLKSKKRSSKIREPRVNCCFWDGTPRLAAIVALRRRGITS